MNNHEKIKPITVHCVKDHRLWKYTKKGGGRLQKCYEDQIGKDYTGQIDPQLSLGEIVYCTQCQPPLAVATLTLIHGRRAYEIDQQNVRKIRT